MEEINSIEKLISKISPRTILDFIGWEWNYDVNNFIDMGVDELDIVEMVMKLEREFDISISDDVLDKFYIVNPKTLIKSHIRNEKFKILGI